MLIRTHALVISVLGLATLNNAGFTAASVVASVCLVSVAFWGARKAKKASLSSSQILAALAISVWFAAANWSLIVYGQLGLDGSKRMLRSAIALGVPLILTLLAICPWKRWREFRTGKLILVVGTVTAYLANALLYVDDYFPVHTVLFWIQAGFVWHLVSTLPNQKTSPSLVPILALLGLASLFAPFTILNHTNTKYLAALHTVNHRFVLENVYAVAELPQIVEQNAGRVRRFLVKRDGPIPVATSETIIPPSPPALNKAMANINGVILVVLDTKRPKDFGIYNSRAETPEIDSCFKDAFVFENAYSAANNTYYSVPAIYSGTYPSTRQQGRVDLPYLAPWFRHAGSEQGLAAHLSKEGFQTTLVSDDWYTKAFFEEKTQEFAPIFSGFDTKHVSTEPKEVKGVSTILNAEKIVPQEGRYFTAVHILSHPLSELSFVDLAIGKICDQIEESGRTDDTLLILTADHGFQEREHGRTTYGHTLFDSEIKVPLLMRHPRMAGRRIEAPVSAIDHFPTIAEVVGAQTPFVEGRSYLDLLKGDTLRPQPIFSETRKPFHSTAIIHNGYKMIRWVNTDTYALFDLKNDPDEARNLIGSEAEKANELRQKLGSFLEERGELDWRP